MAQTVKLLPAMQETRVRSLVWEDPLEKEMATHSRTLGRLQSMGLQRVGHGLPFPSPEDLPKPGFEPESPALQVYALLSEPPGKPIHITEKYLN